MIRISAGYSMKVPGEKEYSSNGYHLTIEAELPDVLVNDPEQLRNKISGIFNEARDNVEAQVGNGNNGSKGASQPLELASDKQKSFIVSLARRRHGMTPEDLSKWNGGVDLARITKQEASRLITELKGGAL